MGPRQEARFRVDLPVLLRGLHDCRKHDTTARGSEPMGCDGGHHRDRHGVRRGTGADLSAAQLHPGAAGDDARPDRLVGGDDAAGFHCVRALHSGAGAARGRSAACGPVFDPGRAHPDRDCLDAGRPGLDAAALPARLLRQSAFFALAPLLLFAVFTAAAFEQVLLSLFAVYGAALGSAEERIASLITCFVAGNAVLQIVLGRVAEQLGSTRTMSFCALASLAGCLLLRSIFDSWLIWPLVFVWGGVSFGIYTTSLIQLGERFSGQALIAGNAAFAFVWGIGGIVGSPATGLAMQLIGHQGLPSSLGLLCGVLAVFLMAERRRV